VRRLADVAGTRPPDEIYLTSDVNAGVMEETRLLGLVAGRRRMFIGAPLLAGFREDQFLAVLTHELAHYSNRDTRLSGVVYRGRRALVRTVGGLNRADWFQRMLAWLLGGYLKLYLRVSTAVCRRQESAADEAAARAAGSAAAAGALRELAAIHRAWEAFTRNHLLLGWRFGYLPADVFGGFAEFRGSVADQLAEIRRNPPAETLPYDTHPPLNTRVAAIEALTAAPVIEVGDRAAITVLRDPATVLDAALMSGLAPEARIKRRADWATLATLHGRAVASAKAATALDNAANAIGQRQTLRTLLDVLDAGRLPELAGHLENLPDGAQSRARREFARDVVLEAVTAEVQLSLVTAGVARFEPSWASGAELVLDEPYATRLPPLLTAACADPADTAGLRGLLEEAGADLDGPVPSTQTGVTT
jgi:Zn-dependent protease with chaperone function